MVHARRDDVLGRAAAVSLVCVVACAQPAPAATTPSASPSPTATIVAVPNVSSYFRRIQGYEFPDAPSALKADMIRAAAAVRAQGMVVSLDTRVVLRDGRQIPVAVMAAVIDPAHANAFFAEWTTAAEREGGISRTTIEGDIPAIWLKDTKGAKALSYQQGIFVLMITGVSENEVLEIASVLIKANRTA